MWVTCTLPDNALLFLSQLLLILIEDSCGFLHICFCVGCIQFEIYDWYTVQVVNYWAEKGVSGFTVYKFRMKRIEGQPELTTNQVSVLSQMFIS